MYRIQVSRKPLKFLRTLPDSYKNAIKIRLKQLEENPIPYGSIHLIGMKNCFRLRVGPFRIQYQIIEEDKIILVFKISRRDETTYKSLL